MSEQDATAPEQTQDTPNPEAPAEETPQQLVDYEQRYNSLRPEFDRKSQQLAELEARLAEYEAQLAPEEQDDEFEEYDFEDSVARKKLEELEARLAEKEKAETLQRQQAEESAFIDSELEAIEKELDDELSDSESNWIGNYALVNRTEDGKPDVRLAYKAFSEIIDGRRSKWVKTKKASKPGSGAAAVEKVDLSDPKQRIAYANRRMAELNDS